jgi:hypothetical protein
MDPLSPQQMLVMTKNQIPEFRGVMQHIISGVQANDLLQPLKTMLDRRHSYLQSKSSTSSPQAGESATPRTPRSVYREVAFLTLVSLGQDNIDLTAFDREYRRAYENLPQRHADMCHPCDKPPSLPTAYCRKLFRELRL